MVNIEGNTFNTTNTEEATTGDNDAAIPEIIENIAAVEIVLEVKQISPIKELKGEILARRPMQS